MLRDEPEIEVQPLLEAPKSEPVKDIFELQAVVENYYDSKSKTWVCGELEYIKSVCDMLIARANM